MKIFYSPQVSRQRLEYTFEGERVTAFLNGVSDTFDFSELPEGSAEDIETDLPINPIISAKPDADGTLWLELLNFISEDAPEADRFPEWTDV